MTPQTEAGPSTGQDLQEQHAAGLTPPLPDDEGPGPENRFAAQLARNTTLWTFGILVIMAAVFGIARPDAFATVFNIRNIFVDASLLLVMAVGMTYVIITAGIDLSVGSVLVFSGVVAAKIMEANGARNAGWGVVLLGALAALAAGTGWGVLNGLLITKARIPPLIATLGTMGMALGFAQIITNGTDVSTVPQRLEETVGTGRLFGEIPYLVIVAAAVALVGGLVLALTRFGRHTFAVGSNAEAARRVGINVDLHLIKVYALAGFLSGLAGVLSLGFFTTTTIGSHANDNLSVIAGVVLGGASLFGGVGTIAGTVIGILIPGVLRNGLVIVGVQPFWQNVAVGAVLVIAVYFDQLRRRARERA
jgi:ribose transport system permease protein